MKWLLVILMVFATVLSDLLQSYEMKRAGEQSVGARGLVRLLKMIAQRRFLILAVACMAVSFFSFMALVQTEPLSFAVPASAASFILETILAKFVLKEHVGVKRAAGALIVLAGVVLLGERPAWTPRQTKESRLRELEEQIAGDAIPLRLERARLLDEVGRAADARDAYLDVLSREPSHRAALNLLGALLHDTGYRTAARTPYAESVARHPGDPVGHLNLANSLRESGDLATAREHYETALRLQPDIAGAHQGLASVLEESGDHAGAALHRQAEFANRPVVALPYRGQGPPVSVLLLAGSRDGNLRLRHFLDAQIFQTFLVFVEFYKPNVPLPPHRLVFNAIGDADLAGPALAAARSVLALTNSPVINAPSAVAATGRSDNAQRLAGIPGLIVPRTVTQPRSLLASANAATTLRRHGFDFPLLIRSPGFHTGRHFLRVESIAQWPSALAELPGEDLIVLCYLDARGPDGKSRKYRVMMIDGVLYPLHLAISSDWKIHYFTAEMMDHPEYRAEEAEFLENMEGVLGSRAIAALAEIQSRLGLDYAGIDFGLSASREILLFEPNATMVVNPPEPDAKWAYRRHAIERIHAAMHRMLMGRAAVTGI